jgi:WD40 repeat protein
MSEEEAKGKLKRKLSLDEGQVNFMKQKIKNKRSKHEIGSRPDKKSKKEKKELAAMKGELTFQKPKPKSFQTPEEEQNELELLESFMFNPSAIVPRDMAAISKMKLEEKEQSDMDSIEEETTLRKVEDLVEAWNDDDEQDFEIKLRAMTLKREENKNGWLKFYDSAKDLETPTSNLLSNAMIPQRKLTYQIVRVSIGGKNKFKRPDYNLSGIQFHPNGQLFIAMFGKYLYINEIAPFFEKNRRMEASGGNVKDARWKLGDIGLVRKVEILKKTGEHVYSTSLVLAPNGDEVFIGGIMGLMCYHIEDDALTQISTGKATALETSLTRAIKKLVCSPDGLYLAVVLLNMNVIQVVDIRTKQTKYEIRVGPVVNDLCFTPNSAYFHLCCSDGTILNYETKTGTFISKRVEVGALSVTCMAISPNGQFQAIGNSSGIVNIYAKTFDLTDTTEKPNLLKTLYNFRDPMTHMRFNSHGQVLSMFSETVGKMLHTSSMTVYQDFTLQTINCTKSLIRRFEPLQTYQDFSKDSIYWGRTSFNNVELYKFPFYGKHAISI